MGSHSSMAGHMPRAQASQGIFGSNPGGILLFSYFMSFDTPYFKVIFLPSNLIFGLSLFVSRVTCPIRISLCHCGADSGVFIFFCFLTLFAASMLKLLQTKDMLLLALCFSYTGKIISPVPFCSCCSHALPSYATAGFAAASANN